MSFALKARLPLCFSAALALLGFAGTANAIGVRYVQATGTASGAGTVTITVETFSKPDFPGRLGPKSAASCTTGCPFVVPIPNGFTANQTADAIADSAASILGPENFTATVVAGYPNTAAICWNGVGDIASIMIVETVPGQTIVEVPATSVPTLTEWGLILLAMLMAGLGIFMMRRRFSPARMTT